MDIEKKSVRITEIDIAKGIGILLTIIGHSTLWETPSHNFIYAFHMPLFFFLSGLVMKDFSFCTIKRECQKLLANYLIWSLLFCLFDVLFNISNMPGKGATVLSCLILTFTFWGISVLWFLPSLLLAKLLVFFIRKVSSAFIFQLCILLCFVLIALYSKQFIIGWNSSPNHYRQVIYYGMGTLIRAVILTPFTFVGIYSQLILRKILQLSRHISFCISLAFFTVVFICSQFMGRIDLHVLDYSFYPAFVLVALLGCYGTVLFSHTLSKSDFFSPVFINLGQNSLFIMATHNYFFVPDSAIFLLALFHIHNSMLYSAFYYMLLLCIEFILIRFLAPFINYTVSLLYRK